MEKHHSARRVNADRKVRSADKKLFWWYCYHCPLAFAWESCPWLCRVTWILPKSTSLLVTTRHRCCFLTSWTLLFHTWCWYSWQSLYCLLENSWGNSLSRYQAPDEELLLTIFPVLWDSLSWQNPIQFPGIRLSVMTCSKLQGNCWCSVMVFGACPRNSGLFLTSLGWSMQILICQCSLCWSEVAGEIGVGMDFFQSYSAETL